MSDIKISALTSASSLSVSDLGVTVQGGVTKQFTYQKVVDLITANLDLSPYFKKDGSVTATGDWNLGNHSISGINSLISNGSTVGQLLDHNLHTKVDWENGVLYNYQSLSVKPKLDWTLSDGITVYNNNGHKGNFDLSALTLDRTIPFQNKNYSAVADLADITASAVSPLTTKGDIWVRNGSADTRLPVGTDGYVLTADASQASGVKWAAVTSGSSSFSGLTDVSLTSISDAQFAQYHSGTSKWENVSISGDITISNTGVAAIGSGKVTNSMLAGSIAASKLIGTDITTVGTIISGTWNGTAIADGNLATSYIKADGTRALTADWGVGTFSLTGIKSFAISGTAGAGYGEFIAQSSAPSAPSVTGFRLSAGSTGNFGWTKYDGGTDTFRRSFSGTLTANRIFTWQDSSYTVAGIDIAQTFTGIQTFAPTTQSSGSNSLVIFTGAAHTNQTASAELVDINFNLARTVQFATGSITTQRATRIQAPTYSFVGASTITNAATLAISGAPTAGTNATITNNLSLVIESGGLGFLDGSTYRTALTVAATNSLSIASGFTSLRLPASVLSANGGASSCTMQFSGLNFNCSGGVNASTAFSGSTTGTFVHFALTGQFNKSSITGAEYRGYEGAPTINQSGTSTGDVSMFYANPSITSFVNTNILSGFRSAIASGTGRWNVYADGTASNYLAGNTGIGTNSLGTAFLTIGAATTNKAAINLVSGSAPTSPNNGDIWFDGTNLKMQIGGVTKTFTLT